MKTAIITGASGDIGFKIAQDFKNLGYKVFGTFNNTHIDSQDIEFIKCDVKNEKEVNEFVEKVLNKTGRIDVLVNNAGICKTGVFQSFSEDDFNKISDTNLKGAFFFSKAVCPAMINQKFGRIINISSVWGVSGASCEAVYSASKAGLIGFTKALAKELAPSGITVNSVSPGVIKTKMLDCYSAEELKDLENQTPIGRLGTPEDVSNAVLFFANEKSDFISGQNLIVDGLFNS